MVSPSSCAVPGPHLMSCVLLSQPFCCLFRLFEVCFLYSPPLLLSLLQPQHRRPPDDPPQPVIYVQSYSNLLSSHKQDRGEHLLAGCSQGVCCVMREKALCAFQAGVKWEMSIPRLLSAVVWSVFQNNKTVIAGTLAPTRSRGFCKGCAAEPSTDLNPTRRCGCFISTLSNGRLTDSLLAPMTAAVPRPRCRNAMMFM